MNLITKTIPSPGHSRTFLTQWSEKKQQYIPVTIKTNMDKSVHIFCPFGDHHKKAIDRASELLKKKGYKIERVNVETTVYEVIWLGRGKKNKEVT